MTAVRSPTEKLRELQWPAVAAAGAEQSLGSLHRSERGEKIEQTLRPKIYAKIEHEIVEGNRTVKSSSDSCYSRSDNSSTDSECPRGPRLGQRPPMRGDTSSLCQQLEDAARLERLCPRVRTQPPRTKTYTDSTSLSSVDTSSSSSDLWNVRAMPDVPVARLNTKPISLRANPAVRQRPSVMDSLTDDLLTRILAYLTTRQLLGVTRVCRRFYFLAWEPELWERIVFSEDSIDVDRALKTTFQLVQRNGVSLSASVQKT